MNGNFETIRQILARNEPIAIICSLRPTLDEMAAALSLYIALGDSGKNVSIVSPQEPLVEVASLVGIDKVKRSFDGGKSGDLTVSFPYQEGEIDKISYTLEGGFLNIIVKASQQGLSFSEKDVLFKRSGDGPSVIFTIGVGRLSDLTPIFNLEEVKNTTIVNIDNKPDNQGYGEIVLVNPQASSLSEEVANLILGLDLRLDIDASQNILSGISAATNNFSNPKTSALSFEMAAIMMRNGARREQRREDRQSFTPPVSQNPILNPILTQNPNQQVAQTPRSGQAGQQNPNNRGNIQREYQKEDKDTTPPGDWLEPKIFKGSTNVG